MQVISIILAAALANPVIPGPPLPVYYISDAPSVVEQGWQRVVRRRDGRCAVEVTGNGMFYRITMRGFPPGELSRFHLTNGDMPPVDYRFVSDEAGQFSKIYIPFRRNRDGGLVVVNAEGEDCHVSVSFPWERQKPRVH